MKNKPDDRRDNMDKTQKTIDKTVHNMETAEEINAQTFNPKMKKEYDNRNARRE